MNWEAPTVTFRHIQLGYQVTAKQLPNTTWAVRSQYGTQYYSDAMFHQAFEPVRN